MAKSTKLEILNGIEKDLLKEINSRIEKDLGLSIAIISAGCIGDIEKKLESENKLRISLPRKENRIGGYRLKNKILLDRESNLKRNQKVEEEFQDLINSLA